MARLARLYAPAVVQHIVQRPADGRVLFVDQDDYRLFTALLADAVRANGLALHAYVLLPSQIRLLGTPRAPESIGRTLQAIGRRYVAALNRKTGRSGALWDRRYRATLIDADTYLLPSMRLIEQMPAIAHEATDASTWRWSSLGHHVGGERQPFLVDHAVYWSLSDTPFERQALYRALVETPLESSLARRIDDAVERGWALGDARFVAALAPGLSRRASPLQRGRPRTRSVPELMSQSISVDK